MRTRNGWLVLLLTAGAALAPAGVRGQEVPPPDFNWPIPTARPDKAGFYTAAEFVFYRQTNEWFPRLLALPVAADENRSVTFAFQNHKLTQEMELGSETKAVTLKGGPEDRLKIPPSCHLSTKRLTHPGELLKRLFLDEMGITQVDFAAHTGMSLQRLNEIIHGKRGITAQAP